MADPEADAGAEPDAGAEGAVEAEADTDADADGASSADGDINGCPAASTAALRGSSAGFAHPPSARPTVAIRQAVDSAVR
ncbi:hypothetical protein [Kitasatospora griseola]|uniref:hypothetical protein n=1 Tax=Kitasatospora griseola TaxID=2064 RepID=UPI001670DE17|nr:hypothetical protein [Kitasatospora griseola]